MNSSYEHMRSTMAESNKPSLTFFPVPSIPESLSRLSISISAHDRGMFLKSNYLKVIRLHQTTICVLSKGLLQRSQLSSKPSVGVPLLTISLSHGVIFCICLVQQGCHTYKVLVLGEADGLNRLGS